MSGADDVVADGPRPRDPRDARDRGVLEPPWNGRDHRRRGGSTTSRPSAPGTGGFFGRPPGHGTAGEPGHGDLPDGGPGAAPRRRPWRLHDPVPGAPETRDDPQLAASLNTLARAGVDPDDAFPPREVAGAVADAEGPSGVAAGDDCDVRLLPARMGPYGCLARVRCGGKTLYPDSDEKGGFVACELGDDGEPIRAVDERTGLDDGDPTLDYDAELGEVAITRDDGTRAVIRLGPR